MTEIITSRYNTLYWFKICAAPAGIFIFIIIFYNKYVELNPTDTLKDKMEVVILLAVVPLIYFIRLLYHPPKRITVSSINIVVNEYITKKQRVIEYDDIEKMRTIRRSGNDAIFSGLSDYQILEIELKTGKTFRFDESQYENYSSLKDAIYDHKFRGL